MKTSLIYLFMFGSFIFQTTAHAADKYKGRWTGGASTSIEILSKSPLKIKYCYKRECSIQKPKGNLNQMVFNFPKRGNFAGADMTMSKRGEKYYGEYQLKNSTTVYQATLNKR